MRAVQQLSFRNIARHRLRFVLTTFSVLLGVSFVVASFVLTDGLRSTFNRLISEGFEETDLQVQERSDFEEIMFTYRSIDEEPFDVVSSVECVEVATPCTESAKIVCSMPTASRSSRRRCRTLPARRPEQVRLRQHLPGFVLVSFPHDELQRLDGSKGELRTIEISAADGVDIEVVTGDDLGGFVDLFGNVLLAFAFVAVFVSAFIISNTFNILLGQRVRQLSLLRALGAGARQVRRGAVIEALIIGLVASLLGLVGRVLLAFGLRALIDTLGFTMPGLEIIISTRTVVFACLVGIGVTLVAAMSPARRAAGVPPMAGLRGGYRFGSGEGTRRTVIAIVLAVFGDVIWPTACSAAPTTRACS